MAQPGPQQLVRVYDTGNIAEAFQQDAARLLSEGWAIQSQSTPSPGQMIVVYARAAQTPAIHITNTVFSSPVQTTVPPPTVPMPRAYRPPVAPPSPLPRVQQPYTPEPRDYGLDHLSPLARKLHTPKNALIGVGVNLLTLLMLVTLGGASSGGADIFALLLLLLNVAVLAVDGRNALTLHGILPWGRWFQRHPVLLSIAAFFLWPYFLGFGFAFGPLVYFCQCYQLSARVEQMEHEQLRANIAALEAELLPRPDGTLPPTQRQ